MKSAKKVKAHAWFHGMTTPVWVIPRTTEAYDAMVEQMTRAILANWDEGVVGFDCVQHLARENAKAALRAIGITRPKQSKQ